jgi:hypothetical protein
LGEFKDLSLISEVNDGLGQLRSFPEKLVYIAKQLAETVALVSQFRKARSIDLP